MLPSLIISFNPLKNFFNTNRFQFATLVRVQAVVSFRNPQLVQSRIRRPLERS